MLLFESSVNLYGIQTYSARKSDNISFESSVNFWLLMANHKKKKVLTFQKKYDTF